MADPLYVTLAKEFRERLLAQDAALAGEMAQRWLKVERSLQGDIQALVEKLARLREADPQANAVKIRNALLRREDYARLLAQVQGQLRRFGAEGLISTAVNGLAAQGLADGAALIEAVAPGVGGLFNRLGSEAVENIVAVARAGQPLARLLANAYPLGASGITDKLVEGVARGINPRETTRRILREGLSQALNHILLVSRDQQIRAYREASRQQYQASGVVQGYRRLAAKNDRTCMACLALYGTVYDTADFMPLHPQDRCAMVPIVAGFDPPVTESGEAWFKRQAEATQIKMMGGEKWAAWQQGKFEFNQLVTVRDNATWGPGAQVTSLKDLLNGRGGFTPGPIRPAVLYTPEYQTALAELRQVEENGEFFEGELQAARDAVALEEEASAWARRAGLKPSEMSQRDWSRLANDLKREATEDLELARAEDREAAGNRSVNRRRVENGDYIQVGGQPIQRKWVGGSRKRAEEATRRINQQTERAAREFMEEKLVGYGYRREQVRDLNYTQQRRLMAEIGNGLPQKANIGQVPRADRERVIFGTPERGQRAAKEVAYNPRAGAGLEKWGGYETAMLKAGREAEIEFPPDLRDDIPEYVQPQSGAAFDF